MVPHNHHGHHHHHHNHSIDSSCQKESLKKIRFAFFLNLLFSLVEFFGGMWTQSLAIMSDALHDFGDSMALGLSWYFEKISHKKGDQIYSFGYRRFSLVGAWINCLILLVGSVYILSEAIPRLFHPTPVNASGMLGLSLLGIFVNGVAVWRMYSGGKHSYNEKVVIVHLMEDVLGWVATFIVSVIVYFKDLPILDPLLCLVVTAFVLRNVVKNIRQMAKIFLQSVPETINLTQVSEELSKIPKVSSVHHIHVWTLDGTFHILTAHIVVENISLIDLPPLKKKVRQLLKERGVAHSTIEWEFDLLDKSFEECP